MNTNELFDYFTRNYSTKNEVLCRLPLNTPIESFWENLQSYRKSKGVFLPLRNASGMPFWYVLTDKMITASEKLADAARNNDCGSDPYKTSFTPALNEELFFTAFLEGAQIDMPTAMEIAETDREPQNVQEQIVYNNKKAWGFMLKHLSKPIEKKYVKSLSYFLTEEMAGNSDSYRTSEKVLIPAMGQEQYFIPSAMQLPDLMDEFYAFLSDRNTHPLIKAAAGHGFILAVRPFADGDERLARMLSYAVLLRSGYNYFKDISLSKIITKESFAYFNAMRETMRKSNGGDLTYFMEYYLGILVRAQDSLNGNGSETVLSAERELAKKPILLPGCRQAAITDKHDFSPKTNAAGSTDAVIVPQQVNTEWDYTLTRNEAIKRISQKVRRISTDNNPVMQRVRNNLMKVLDSGHISFSTHDYEIWCSISYSLVQSDRNILRRKNIISERRNEYGLVFNIYMPRYDGLSLALPKLRTHDEVDNYLLMLECAGDMIEYKLAFIIAKALEQNQSIFSKNSWDELISRDNISSVRVLERAEELGICTRIKAKRNSYEISINETIFDAYNNLAAVAAC